MLINNINNGRRLSDVTLMSQIEFYCSQGCPPLVIDVF